MSLRHWLIRACSIQASMLWFVSFKNNFKYKRGTWSSISTNTTEIKAQKQLFWLQSDRSFSLKQPQKSIFFSYVLREHLFEKWFVRLYIFVFRVLFYVLPIRKKNGSLVESTVICSLRNCENKSKSRFLFVILFTEHPYNLHTTHTHMHLTTKIYTCAKKLVEIKFLHISVFTLFSCFECK